MKTIINWKTVEDHGLPTFKTSKNDMGILVQEVSIDLIVTDGDDIWTETFYEDEQEWFLTKSGITAYYRLDELTIEK